MRLGRITAALAAVAAVLALAAGCGGARTGATGADATISVYSTEPRSALTPGGAGDARGFCVLSTLLAGLVVYDEQGKPVNEVASSITPNDDSTVFTVTLGHGWTFTDGTPVTARSFTRAWSYAANPANAQINASYFANIQGYGDLQRSTDGTEQLAGLVVTGDESFEIHLSAPDSILPQKLGTVPFLPLPDSFYDDPDAYASKPVGNGAYRFSSWTHGQDLTVTRNDGYHGAMPARNGGIDFRFYTSTDAAFMDVIAGNLDLLDEVPASKYAVYASTDGIRSYTVPGAETQGLNIPERLAHFGGDEGRLRRHAISMAIDRDLICSKIFHGTRQPAVDFSAPTITGYSDQLANARHLAHNAAQAKELWAQADAISPWSGTLRLSYSADSNDQAWVEAVANQIANTLGISAQAEPWTSRKELRTAAVDGTIDSPYGSEWPPDYPHIENYLTQRFASNGGYNEFGYASRQVDDLLARAAASTDEDQAVARYQEAEEILLDDLPQIPLWYANVAAVSSMALTHAAFTYSNYPLYAALEK